MQHIPELENIKISKLESIKRVFNLSFSISITYRLERGSKILFTLRIKVFVTFQREFDS